MPGAGPGARRRELGRWERAPVAASMSGGRGHCRTAGGRAPLWKLIDKLVASDQALFRGVPGRGRPARSPAEPRPPSTEAAPGAHPNEPGTRRRRAPTPAAAAQLRRRRETAPQTNEPSSSFRHGALLAGETRRLGRHPRTPARRRARRAGRRANGPRSMPRQTDMPGAHRRTGRSSRASVVIAFTERSMSPPSGHRRVICLRSARAGSTSRWLGPNCGRAYRAIRSSR